MEKKYDVLSVGTMAYDMILRTVDESIFTRDTTMIDEVGISPGGAAFISMVTAQRLGCRAAAVGKLAEDVFGNYLMQYLKDSGVDTSYVACSAADITSLTFAMVVPEGERHFVGYAGANQSFCLEDFDLDAVKQAAIVGYGSFFALPGLDCNGATVVLETAKEAGAFTVADCANDSFGEGPEIVFRNLPLIDYFMPSWVEGYYLTQEKDSERMAEYFLKKGCKNVIIKLGSEGCYIRNNNIKKYLPAIPNLKVKDTTGAGDSFVGGFMAGLTEGMDIAEAARYATAVAAVSVTEAGALTALKEKSQVLAVLGQK